MFNRASLAVPYAVHRQENSRTNQDIGKTWTLDELKDRPIGSLGITQFIDNGGPSVTINGHVYRKTTSYWEGLSANNLNGQPEERDLWDPAQGKLVSRKLAYSDRAGNEPDILLPVDSNNVEMTTMRIEVQNRPTVTRIDSNTGMPVTQL